MSNKYSHAIIIALLTALLATTNAIAQTMHFNNYSLDEGLIQITCYDIIQDSHGFVWIATQDGVDRFDGYSFKHFRQQPGQKNSLSENWAWCLLEDSEHHIWMGTANGLNRYNPVNEDFLLYRHDPSKPNTLVSGTIKHLMEDDTKLIWIGTEKGLSVLDKTTGEFTSYAHQPDDSSTLSSDQITYIYQDRQKRIWVGTRNGLNLYQADKNSFKRLYWENISLQTNVVNALLDDKDGNLWVGSPDGLFILNVSSQKFHSPEISDLCDNSINALLRDKTGLMWIATSNGLSSVNPETNEVSCSRKQANEPYSLTDNEILCLTEDNQGNIWMGTLNNGISVYDKMSRSFLHFKSDYTQSTESGNINLIRGFLEYSPGEILVATEEGFMYADMNNILIYDIEKKIPELSQLKDKIYSLTSGNNNDLWIGTFGSGIYNFNRTSKKLSKLSTDNAAVSLDKLKVWDIYVTKNGDLWIGTANDGLMYFNTKNKQVKVFKYDSNDPSSLINNSPVYFLEDSRNNFWVGTEGGLELFNSKDSSFTHFVQDENTPGAISNNIIMCLYESSDGYIWVGTWGGLNRFDYTDSSFVTYREKDGLSNDVIYGIQEDENQNLWFSTNMGINRLNTKTNEVVWYDKQDGLQNNEFNGLANYKDSRGRMYFGGVDGFSVFYPDSIQDNRLSPDVIITKFLHFNKELRTDHTTPPKGDLSIAKTLLNGQAYYSLYQNIEFTKELILDYTDYIFGFEFTALNFRQAQKNKFKYMLEGFDKDWTETDYTNRRAIYTNIPYGEYTFKVIASNDDGYWNTSGYSIAITILPPWWLTWWAKTLWILLSAGSLLSIYLVRVRRLKVQTRILEYKVEERTLEIRKKNSELEQQKEEIQSQAEQLESANVELQKLSIVASETDNAIIIMDPQGNFEWFNHAFSHLYGYSFDDFISKFKNIQEASKNIQIAEIVQSCVENKESKIYESLNESKDGRKLWVQTTLTPIQDENHQIVKLVAIDSDISKLKQYEKEIMEQRDELEGQKNKLHFQNEQIRSSIRYAKKIQTAILPQKSYFDSFFENFILYRPKDIVSGDFYWFAHVESTKSDQNYLFVAAVDCTGHGVPGAFMSMIGYSLFNEIVHMRKEYNPATILEQLNDGVITRLQQDVSDNNDGMDVGLCRICYLKDETVELVYSGAKNSMYYIRKNADEIEQARGDRRSIGGSSNASRQKDPFIAITINLEKEDNIYLLSDGIIDQNDSNRKRYSSKRFKDVILENAKDDMHIQKEKIEQSLDEYQGVEEQRDDITVIAIRL